MASQPLGEGSVHYRSFSFSRVVDLSWPIQTEIPRWPGDPAVEFETYAEHDTTGYFLRRFSMGEHSGTHLSAPAGFYDCKSRHTGFSAQDLVKSGIVIDISGPAKTDPDYALTINDVLDWESEHGPVPQDCIVLLRTGWQAKWNEPIAYLGGDTADTLRFPGFELDTARLLIEGRNISGLGIDTAGIEPGIDREFSVSRLALENRMIVLENVTGLDQLPARDFLLVIGLIQLEGGSGGPTAITALVP